MQFYDASTFATWLAATLIVPDDADEGEPQRRQSHAAPLLVPILRECAAECEGGATHFTYDVRSVRNFAAPIAEVLGDANVSFADALAYGSIRAIDAPEYSIRIFCEPLNGYAVALVDEDNGGGAVVFDIRAR